MSLLQELLAEGCPAATSATSATFPPHAPQESQLSRESQGATVLLRNELLALAAHSDAADVVRALPEGELLATHEQTAGMPDTQRAEVLEAYLQCLDDTRTRNAGRLPLPYTARAICGHCGPVWLPPEIVAAAPVVSGWPWVLGCPWCHVTPPDGIPRPPVDPCECRHWTPDAINPAGGMGQCTCGRNYPHEQRACGQFTPRKATP